MHFRPFPVFWAIIFLSGKSADPTPLPLLVENFTNFFFLKPSLMHVILKKFLGHTNRKTDKVSYRSSFPELKNTVQVVLSFSQIIRKMIPHSNYLAHFCIMLLFALLTRTSELVSKVDIPFRTTFRSKTCSVRNRCRSVLPQVWCRLIGPTCENWEKRITSCAQRSFPKAKM